MAKWNLVPLLILLSACQAENKQCFTYDHSVLDRPIDEYIDYLTKENYSTREISISIRKYRKSDTLVVSMNPDLPILTRAKYIGLANRKGLKIYFTTDSTNGYLFNSSKCPVEDIPGDVKEFNSAIVNHDTKNPYLHNAMQQPEFIGWRLYLVGDKVIDNRYY